jgi:hypothetical protein
MKPGGAKTKGKKFETQISDLIHKRLYDLNEKYRTLYDACKNENLKPKRDSSSGTFNSSTGDIELGIAQQFFPFSIECKHHKDLNLSIESIARGKWSKLQNIFTDQCAPVAEKKGLLPIVVFKANRTDAYVLFQREQMDIDFVSFLIICEKWLIMRFDDFLIDYIKVHK